MPVSIQIIFVIGSYLLGSLSFSVIFHKIFKGGDIRAKDLPGGAGAVRQMGLAKGIIVGFSDIFKVFIPVCLAKILGLGNLTVALCAIAGILGHNWPIFFNFKGGQGLTSMIGGLLPLIPLEGAIAFVVSMAILSPNLKFTWKNRSGFSLTVLSKVTAIFIIVFFGLYRQQPIEFISAAIIMILINILKNCLDKPTQFNGHNY